MIAIPWIIGRLANLWWNLWELYLNIAGIALLRNTLGPIIYKFQDAISSLISDLWELNSWATDVSIAIKGILSWDTILDKIILTLFGGKHPWDWFWDMAWYWLDLYFPWLRDPELTIWEWVGAKARDLAYHLLPWSDIPEMGVREEAERWFLGVLYRVLPWGDDPDLTILAEANKWVRNFIPEFPDIERWIDDHLMAWLEDRAVDIAKMAGRILVRLW